MTMELEGEPLEKQVQYWRNRVYEIEQRWEEKEAEFGQKRARFRELYMAREEEMRKDKQHNDQLEQEQRRMNDEVRSVNSELEEVRTMLAIQLSSNQDEVDTVKHRLEQEISSLQCIINDAVTEATERTASKYRIENEKLIEANGLLISEIQTFKSSQRSESLPEPPGMTATPSKTPHTDNNKASNILGEISKSLKKTGSFLHGDNTADNMEASMKKAQADSDRLRAVVLPLEEEITELKQKLQSAEEKLKLIPLPCNSIEAVEGTVSRSNADEKFEAEKASRTDLELFVAVLNTQKTVLQQDSDSFKQQLQEVCNLLEEEKLSHEVLKQTWQRANDQFLESQRHMMSDLRRMRSILTEEQQRELNKLRQADTIRERSAAVSQNNQIQLSIPTEEHLSVSSSLPATPDVITNTEITQTAVKRGYHSAGSSPRISPKISPRSHPHKKEDLPPSQQPLLTSSLIQRSQSNNCLLPLTDKHIEPPTGAGLNSLFEQKRYPSTVSLPSVICDKHADRITLTDAQMSAITDTTEAQAEVQLMLDKIRNQRSHSIAAECVTGSRLVSEKEWLLLQDEIAGARDRLGQSCDMCLNYEYQLQSVQQHEKETTQMISLLKDAIETGEQEFIREKCYRTDLEESVNNTVQYTQQQMKVLTDRNESLQTQLDLVSEEFQSWKLTTLNKTTSLLEDTLHLRQEVEKYRHDNETLYQLKYTQTAILQDDIQLPTTVEEMQDLLDKYRTDLIASRVGAEYSDDALQSKILFLKQQVSAEQYAKEQIEETLQTDLDTSREELAILRNMRLEYDEKLKDNEEVEAALKETQTSQKTMQAKSKQVIQALQSQLEEVQAHKIQIEEDLHESKLKLQNLHSELENSEAVQRDFVRLSQSLQVQLENIRQMNSEVRWHHEEDVVSCQNCREQFTVTKRKHHCRHCGKIFCTDCSTKTVPSGPAGRLARVCDFCHTLLNNESAPYFVSEVPHTS